MYSIKMMSGSKAPDFDAYGLLRATHSHNPTLYSHIVGLSSHFYAHIGAGPKVFYPPMSIKVGLDLLTLASLELQKRRCPKGDAVFLTK